MKVFQLIGTHSRVLLMNYLQSREQKWYRGKHSIFYSVSRNCDICLMTKITRAPCSKRTGTAVPRAENFGDLITADHKVLGEGCESRNNHRYAVVVQDLATQWSDAWTPHGRLLERRRKPRPVRFVDWVHTIHHIGRKNLQMGIPWSGERLTKKHTTSRTWLLVARDWKDMSEAEQRKEKHYSQQCNSKRKVKS